MPEPENRRTNGQQPRKIKRAVETGHHYVGKKAAGSIRIITNLRRGQSLLGTGQVVMSSPYKNNVSVKGTAAEPGQVVYEAPVPLKKARAPYFTNIWSPAGLTKKVRRKKIAGLTPSEVEAVVEEVERTLSKVLADDAIAERREAHASADEALTSFALRGK